MKDVEQTRAILAVDDDPLVLDVILSLIEELGHVAIAAESAAKALQIVEADLRLDLLLADQQMPGMTGTELAGAVMLLRPDIKVIISTGYDELPAEAGQSFILLRKPYSIDQLGDAINAAFA